MWITFRKFEMTSPQVMTTNLQKILAVQIQVKITVFDTSDGFAQLQLLNFLESLGFYSYDAKTLYLV